MDELKLISISSFSLKFPETKKNEIIRHHLLAGIEKKFENRDVVTLEGEEGIGKTTLIKQFAEKHPNVTFTSFISPVVGRFREADSVLRDFYNQIFWYINRQEYPKDQSIDNEKYNNLIYQLQRDNKTRKANLIFAIDGLEYIQDETTRGQIISYVPLNDLPIKLLLTENLEGIQKLLNKDTKASNLSLSTLSREECKELLKGLTVNEAEIDLVYKNANHGLPGKLSDIIRHLNDYNVSVTDFFNNPETSGGIHEIDYQKLVTINEDLLTKSVACLALDDKPYSLTLLSNVLNVEEYKLRSILNKVSFITLSATDELNFTSNNTRIYFARKLKEHKKFVIDANIAYLLKFSDEVESLTELPKYYESGEQFEDVIAILSEDYFPKLLKQSESLTAVTNSVTLGFNAAKHIGNDQKLLSYSLYASLIKNVEGLHVWGSEIEARIELGDYDSAINLANSALLKEDRLGYLARIAKAKKKKKEVIEETLIDQITQLYKSVDFKSLGARSVNIAADLFYSIPSLALKVIQTTSDRDEKFNEWMLTKLALAAFDSKNSTEIKSTISSLTSDSKVREITSSLSVLFEQFDQTQILEETDKITDSRQKLLLLKVWIMSNPKSEGIEVVMNSALDEFIKLSSQEFAGVALLTDLIEPVTNANELNKFSETINKALKFKDEVKRLGSSIDFLKFSIVCIKAKIKVKSDYGIAITLFNEAHSLIESLDDIVIKTECLALLNNCLFDIANDLHANQRYLAESIRSQLENLIKQICDSTAYHYDNLKDIIDELTKIDYKIALDVCSKANTIATKEKLTFTCYLSYLDHKTESIKVTALKEIYSKFMSLETRAIALRNLMALLHDTAGFKTTKELSNFIITESALLAVGSTKCYILCELLVILSREQAVHVNILKDIEKDLDDTWKNLDIDVSKIEIGFQLAELLAPVAKDLALEYLERAKDLKKSFWPDSINTITVYSHYVALMIKAFSGLIKSKSYDDTHLQKIEDLITNIPSPSTRIALWGNLAEFAHQKNDLTLREKIVNTSIRPTLDGIKEQAIRDDIYVDICPLLFYSNQVATLKEIEKLAELYREDSLTSILNSLLCDELRDESNERLAKSKIPYTDLTVACDLIQMLNVDYNVYKYLEIVVDGAKDKSISYAQKEEIKQRLTIITNNKLPNSNYIKHQGYKIVCLATLLKLEKDVNIQTEQFRQLVEKVEKEVTNLSDRAFIYIVFGELVPNLKSNKIHQMDMVNKALQIIEKLNFGLEFVHRIDFFSKSFQKLNPKLWKEKVKLAFEKTIQTYYRHDAMGVQRRLIDKAFKYEPDFAKSLIKSLDQDEARIQHRKKTRLKEYYDSLSILKQMAEDKVEKCSADELAKACFESSGTITLKNSKKVGQMRYLFDLSKQLPIRKSYPIYDYYLENITFQ